MSSLPPLSVDGARWGVFDRGDYMSVGIGEEKLRTLVRGLYTAGDQPRMRFVEIGECRVGVSDTDENLPVCQVIGSRVFGDVAAISRHEVLQQLDAGTLRRTKTGDSQVRAEDVVQVLLFLSVVFACAGDVDAELVAIEGEARVSVADCDRSMVDAEEQLRSMLP